MHTNRREFMILTGSLAVASASGSTLAAEPPVPVLSGDGVTDDTAALNALFSGRDIRVAGPGRFSLMRGLDGRVTLIGGRFRTSQSFRHEIRRGRHRIKQNNLV